MKNLFFTLITTTALLFSSYKPASAQNETKASFESPFNAGNLHLTSMKSYAEFKRSVKPLIEKMGVKKIIGLGEGTHGTAEFYKVRYWISRILIEEKGFNEIAFENDFSDSWQLNKQLSSNTDLTTLMKKYMLSIWQNEETKELLSWVKQYNSKHNKKVTIAGIDFVYINTDIEMLKQLLVNTPAANLLDSMAVVSNAAAYQDKVWESLNQKGYKFDEQAISKSSYAGYVAADKLDKQIEAANLRADVKADCHMALLNVKQAFAPYYDEIAKLPEASRDSNMALNASILMQKPGTKMIIWAHNAHVAKTGIYNNEAGGTGGIILKMFPNNYFVLGTGTANGTFSATTDSRDTYTNVMNAYPMAAPVKDSWDDLMSTTGKPAFYFIPAVINKENQSRQMRFIGYGIDSGPNSYDKTNFTDMFDAYLFINNTHAGTRL